MSLVLEHSMYNWRCYALYFPLSELMQKRTQYLTETTVCVADLIRQSSIVILFFIIIIEYPTIGFKLIVLYTFSGWLILAGKLELCRKNSTLYSHNYRWVSPRTIWVGLLRFSLNHRQLFAKFSSFHGAFLMADNDLFSRFAFVFELDFHCIVTVLKNNCCVCMQGSVE